MNSNISDVGAAPDMLTLKSVTWWSITAAQNDVDLTGFDPNASLEERMSWAIDNGFDIGTIYARAASGQQSSPDQQVRECIQWAAKNQVFVPPEFISVDGETSRHGNRLAGFRRAKTIVECRIATVLLVTDLNRLCRAPSRAVQVVDQMVGESGCRVVCVADLIDTNDRFRWQIASLIASELFHRQNRSR